MKKDGFVKLETKLMEQIIKIAVFIFDSLAHIWPYLLISIPLAVAAKHTGASKFINKAITRNPLVAILLATVVGAFSPFCSCGVIPVIATLLLGGVPLAPVMSFWIASPSMDPEIFFLSVATVGWKMSIWRLTATFVISLMAGYISHFATIKGFIDKEVLRHNRAKTVKSPWKYIWNKIKEGYPLSLLFPKALKKIQLHVLYVDNSKYQAGNICCVAEEMTNCCGAEEKTIQNSINTIAENACTSCKTEDKKQISTYKKLGNETWKATLMVVKFMTLAFFVNALIKFYIPQEFISSLLGGKNSFSVIIATLIGIPAYTTNLTALPLISGLLTLGMNPGAALAFLIAGPTTTLPAIIAVWGIAKRKIFLLYISFSLFGAVLFGLIYNLIA